MDLLANPFHLLGASPRDNKLRLLELAEERDLHEEPDAVAHARATLSHPRKRLAAEVGWLPGLAPTQAAAAMRVLLEDPSRVNELSGIPALCRANLLASALSRGIGAADSLPGIVLGLAETFEKIDREALLRLVNDDRAVAGIQVVAEGSWVDEAFAERRAHFKVILRGAFDRLPSRDLVDSMTRLMERVAPVDGGAPRALTLVDDLLDAYEVEATRFLDAEAGNVAALVSVIRKALKGGAPRPVIDRLLARLEEVVRNWDVVAQPIQLSARSRGRDHDISHRVGFEVRSLAIDLYNKHELLEDSKRLTELLHQVFVEVPEVSEHISRDAQTLKTLAEDASQSGGHRQEQEKAIRFKGVVFGLFNEPLEIGLEGITWKGQRWPLECITRVRWGGTRRIENGVAKANFTIAFGTDAQMAVVSSDDTGFFEEVTDKLWRAVGVRLLWDMLKRVRAGEALEFGQIKVSDLGAELPRRFTPGRVFVPWSDLTIGTHDGEFRVTDRNRKNTVFASASFEHGDNTHILSFALGRFFKNTNPKLSSLLDD